MHGLRVVKSAGIAAIVLYPIYVIPLSNTSDARLHSSSSLAVYAFALIANLCLVTLAVASFWNLIYRTRFAQALRFLLFPGLVAVALQAVYFPHHLTISLPILFSSFTLALLFAMTLQRPFPAVYRRVQQLTETVPVGLGLYCIAVVIQLLLLAKWHPTPNDVEARAPNLTGESSTRPRVIWILMDELSYSQVFETRAAGLHLPNFDELRKSSTVFSDVQPVSEYTVTAVPSLMLGRPVQSVVYTADNQYLVAMGGGPPTKFPAAETPFALAQSKGMTTGVAGWYNPYCTMLQPYLNRCYWINSTFFFTNFMEDDSFLQDVANSWIWYWDFFRSPNDGVRERQHRITEIQDIDRHARELLEDDQVDFVFVHLSIPHPPGIFDRRTDTFDLSRRLSYFDNLALADKTLGQFITTLRQSPRWSHTSVVINGDHSWRTFIWRKSRFWTPEEDQVAPNSTFDPRPMLMVHQFGQTTPQVIGEPFPLIRVHDIVDSLIMGKQPNFH